MDLHVVAPLASPPERAAVDAVLDPEIGPPVSAFQGGTRASGDGHVARGGHEARSRRDLLLPTLHAVQDRIGWISQPALGYISRRLTVPPAEAYGVATFYALLATRARAPIVAHVCDDIACRLAGAEDTCATLERSLGPAGAPTGDGKRTWLRSPCLGFCERAPAALFTVAGESPNRFSAAPIDAAGVLARLESGTPILPTPRQPPSAPEAVREGAVSATSSRGGAPDLPADTAGWIAIGMSVPQLGDPGLRLLSRVGRTDPTSLDDYRAHSGYAALARALELGPAGTIDEVSASGLLGRGGAAFPTGRKWAAVAGQAAQPHYFVCNADESEPGTFKDRILMEHDPFAVVEG
ncbi:MAG TPA: NAD(P)H-dependent oxidoreductase subunit E, partial [Candidatus Acidoferrum sp.]|nr:NAD(P)H-dependent oxidoreductase subunit E [Candidatus Acidoferrum sp.]